MDVLKEINQKLVSLRDIELVVISRHDLRAWRDAIYDLQIELAAARKNSKLPDDVSNK